MSEGCPVCGAYLLDVHAAVVDIKRVLTKYIAHVALMEGTDFITHRENWWTDDEWRVLQEARAETRGRERMLDLLGVVQPSAAPSVTRDPEHDAP